MSCRLEQSGVLRNCDLSLYFEPKNARWYIYVHAVVRSSRGVRLWATNSGQRMSLSGWNIVALNKEPETLLKAARHYPTTPC